MARINPTGINFNTSKQNVRDDRRLIGLPIREKKRDLFFVNWIFDSSEKRKKPNTGRINKEGVANNTYGT